MVTRVERYAWHRQCCGGTTLAPVPGGLEEGSPFTFLIHPDASPDNNSSERELRPTATYRKVTGGFRSQWGADLSPASDPSSAQPHAPASTPTRPFSTRYAGAKVPHRVEQIPVKI